MDFGHVACRHSPLRSGRFGGGGRYKAALSGRSAKAGCGNRASMTDVPPLHHPGDLRRSPVGPVGQVLIEIQKAKAPTVVERFRRYLGEQYANRNNVVPDGHGGSEAVPLVTIYLLGYDLGLSDEAVLDVCPRVTERRTGAVDGCVEPQVFGEQRS